VIDALLLGAFASSALLVGAGVGTFWQAGRQITGALLAFASGTLVSALAFELFPVAVDQGGIVRSTAGLVLGASVFVAVNYWLDHRVVLDADAVQGEEDDRRRARGVSFALLASVTLDGIPENLALGASLGATANVALPVAICASNFPEALVGTISMRRSGLDGGLTVGIWTGAALLLTVMAVVGRSIAEALPAQGMAWLLSFGGGAVLASLADTLMPEAFERGRPWNSFATCAGFVVSFALARG